MLERIGCDPKGKRALVCASSKGLGLGCAEALAAAGVNLVMNARGPEALEAEAARLRSEHGVEVQTVACDVTSPDGVAARVVRNSAGNEIRIRYNYIRPVKRFDTGGAHGYVFYISHLAAYLDPVTFRDRTLNQQNNARHKVGHDVLQAKTDTKIQMAGGHAAGHGRA